MRRLAACVLACGLVAGAAEGSDISGFLDMSYSVNLDDLSPNALRRYHNNVDTFVLNAAHLVIGGGVGMGAEYTLELDIGYNNDVETTTDPELVGLQEAYVETEAGSGGLSIRAGKFEAVSGMEGMDSPDNFCISRGLIFSYGLPHTYTGVLLGYSEGQLDFGVGFVNGWDILLDPAGESSLLAKVSMEPRGGDFGFTASYLSGVEGGNDRTTFDVVGSFTASGRTEIEVEYTSTSEDGGDEWTGLGVQALIKQSDMFTLGLRYESFDDPNSVHLPGLANECTSLTIAPAFELSGASTLRLEFRIDTADAAVFGGSDTQKTFTAQVCTTF